MTAPTNACKSPVASVIQVFFFFANFFISLNKKFKREKRAGGEDRRSSIKNTEVWSLEFNKKKKEEKKKFNNIPIAMLKKVMNKNNEQ